ncbi:flagellar hook-length control protein FliK [Burkholderia contaminans]|uniref:flagellar hook-length control protein FliK n=1 Tax=Burkholderia contaminans TaxID=488447 RepID=UPI001CF2310F|nr:flagellar hook-length control protein FliK [Burkholderia contaminans]MCA7915786.1 flagellar hook-length control protein FliK [Burkholderia contaminans]UUX40813.1 flagellar hook-length control protein FliK [Burkholderia contaminans]
MTESVSSPRSRSRSNRSSARSRPRSAAAAGSTSARATVRSGNAPAGDASRDERTLDLFGDPVLEPGERVPAAARDEAGAQADIADDVASGRQAALDGFGAPEAVAAAGHVDAAEGAVTPGDATVAHGVSSPEGGGDANVDVVPASGAAAMKAVDIPLSVGVATKAADGLAGDGAATKADDVPAGDGAATVATKLQATDGAESKATGSQAADGEVEKAAVVAATAVKSREGRPAGDAVKERRASSGGKRRAAAGASDATTEQSAPVVTSVGTVAEAVGASPASDSVTVVEPQTSAQPAKPVIAANAAKTANTANTANTAKAHDAAPRADATVSPVTQPPASAAAFVTKPSSERTQPGAPVFDPDTHLRPLTDRLAALQADVDGLTRTADREMRRVNRLLLALAVVVLAGLVALVMQTRQIAHLKQDVATKQQRIDRLAADLSTQHATLMTLEEHHEALLSQVDRLQRNANREAAVAKRARRTR